MSDAIESGDSVGSSSLEELQLQYNREVESNKRAAAETAYALAFRYRGEDVNGARRFDIAKIWAQRAIELLDSLPSDTPQQIASSRMAVGGVLLPELMHSDIVRRRLQDVLI